MGTPDDRTLPEYDRRLLTAISQFEMDGGQIPEAGIQEGVAEEFSAFQRAAEAGRVPLGYKFDANRTRREVAFRLGFQRFIDSILSDCLPNTVLPVGGASYRAEIVQDRLTRQPHLALVRGNVNVLGVLGGGLAQPGGNKRWYSVEQGFDMAAHCGELRQAKMAAAQAIQADPGRGVA